MVFGTVSHFIWKFYEKILSLIVAKYPRNIIKIFNITLCKIIKITFCINFDLFENLRKL